jgi:hypothetical protein
MTVEEKAKKTRRAKPGMVRVIVTLSQEHHDRLERAAQEQTKLFPRPVNELLSILIGEHFDKIFSIEKESDPQQEPDLGDIGDLESDEEQVG